MRPEHRTILDTIMAAHPDLILTLRWWCPFCRDYPAEIMDGYPAVERRGPAATAGIEMEAAIDQHLRDHVEEMTYA